MIGKEAKYLVLADETQKLKPLVERTNFEEQKTRACGLHSPGKSMVF